MMNSILKTAIAATVLSVPALALAPQSALALDIKDKAELEKFIHDYIVNNPEVLLEAQDALQAKQAAEQRKKTKAVIAGNKDALFHAPGDIVLGNPDGDVTIVEFFDYNCPYCKHAVEDMDTILKEDPNVRFVLKEFPILGPDSLAASHVSIAFRMIAPDKYRSFHEQLLGGQERATEERAFEIAAELGVDKAALEAKMKDPAIESSIKEAYFLANALGITGTPAYVVGDEAVSGALGAEILSEKIENVRKCDSTEC